MTIVTSLTWPPAAPVQLCESLEAKAPLVGPAHPSMVLQLLCFGPDWVELLAQTTIPMGPSLPGMPCASDYRSVTFVGGQ